MQDKCFKLFLKDEFDILGNYAYLLSCLELDEKVNLISVF